MLNSMHEVEKRMNQRRGEILCRSKQIDSRTNISVSQSSHSTLIYLIFNGTSRFEFLTLTKLVIDLQLTRTEMHKRVLCDPYRLP